jgi:hypothetical protein
VADHGTELDHGFARPNGDKSDLVAQRCISGERRYRAGRQNGMFARPMLPK